MSEKPVLILPGLGDERRRRLSDAGIDTLEALAAHNPSVPVPGIPNPILTRLITAAATAKPVEVMPSPIERPSTPRQPRSSKALPAPMPIPEPVVATPTRRHTRTRAMNAEDLSPTEVPASKPSLDAPVSKTPTSEKRSSTMATKSAPVELHAVSDERSTKRSTSAVPSTAKASPATEKPSKGRSPIAAPTLLETPTASKERSTEGARPASPEELVAPKTRRTTKPSAPRLVQKLDVDNAPPRPDMRVSLEHPVIGDLNTVAFFALVQAARAHASTAEKSSARRKLRKVLKRLANMLPPEGLRDNLAAKLRVFLSEIPESDVLKLVRKAVKRAVRGKSKP